MRYLLLLYDDAAAVAAMSAAERRAMVDQHTAQVPRSPGLVAELRPIPDV